MRATVFPALAELRRDRMGGRAATFLLVVLLHLLLVALFVWLSPVRKLLPPEAKVFELLPPSLQPAPKPAPKPATKAKAKAKAPAAAQAPKPVATPQPKLFDKLLLDGFDLAKLPKGIPDTVAADADTGDSASAYGPGEGPGGVRLYNAEWQREPTQAELAYYLPRGVAKGSWALIACRTIPRFQVEDCVQLGESPVGSGLARAMVNAAWQFRVKPPRINSQPQVGEWVKIRFSFSKEDGEGD